MIIWLALDPRTLRVTAQDREFSDGDFPPGRRGLGWSIRSLEVPAQTWTKLMRATYSPSAQDDLHRRWWVEAGGDDVWKDDE